MNTALKTPSLALLTGLALTLAACAGRTSPTASANAEAPGSEGAVATYATTNDDGETHEFLYGTLTVIEPSPSAESNSDSGDDEPKSKTSEVAYAVDTRLVGDCDIDRSVYFDHDSAEVDPAAEFKLDQVAQCLQQPPLKGEPLEIIGHADETGSEEYNRELGLERANSVADALASEGIDRSLIETYSRGEFMADDPSLWDDRRVVIRMAK